MWGDFVRFGQNLFCETLIFVFAAIWWCVIYPVILLVLLLFWRDLFKGEIYWIRTMWYVSTWMQWQKIKYWRPRKWMSRDEMWF